jgi:hypothetical protein
LNALSNELEPSISHPTPLPFLLEDLGQIISTPGSAAEVDNFAAGLALHTRHQHHHHNRLAALNIHLPADVPESRLGTAGCADAASSRHPEAHLVAVVGKTADSRNRQEVLGCRSSTAGYRRIEVAIDCEAEGLVGRKKIEVVLAGRRSSGERAAVGTIAAARHSRLVVRLAGRTGFDAIAERRSRCQDRRFGQSAGRNLVRQTVLETVDGQAAGMRLLEDESQRQV